uniref:WD repeat-containing protein WRAP73 isoform X1 n=2 Tax=Myxine glutinosa TaxID=7769 RepID=UPI00358FE037
MNFSNALKQSGQLCKFSPDGKFLAYCVHLKVVVREVRTLHITHTFSCLDLMNQLEWSADSLFLLCSMHRRAVVQVWSLEEPEWHCKINEGSAGLVHSCWGPDGRHILNTTEFHLRITVWSLCSKSVSYIRYPKTCAKGVDFTQDGQYMALAERRNCKDFVSVFACQDWQLLKHFATDTEDLAGLIWSPNGCVLCIWEASTEYKVLVYSADGRVLFTYSAYSWALGVKAVAWSPSSQFLAVGSYDEKVRVFCDVTWQKIDELSHPKEVSDMPSVVVYEEVESGEVSGHLGAAGGSARIETFSKYEVVKIPFKVSVEEPDPDRANPRLGVGLIAFSSDGHYMATRNDNMRWAVWVWSVGLFRLVSLLHQKRPVETLAWHPSQPRLAITCDGPSVFLWSPGGCVSVVVPSDDAFHVLGVKWEPDGKSFLVMNKTEFCLCYLETEETVQRA